MRRSPFSAPSLSEEPFEAARLTGARDPALRPLPPLGPGQTLLRYRRGGRRSHRSRHQAGPPPAECLLAAQGAGAHVPGPSCRGLWDSSWAHAPLRRLYRKKGSQGRSPPGGSERKLLAGQGQAGTLPRPAAGLREASVPAASPAHCFCASRGHAWGRRHHHRKRNTEGAGLAHLEPARPPLPLPVSLRFPLSFPTRRGNGSIVLRRSLEILLPSDVLASSSPQPGPEEGRGPRERNGSGPPCSRDVGGETAPPVVTGEVRPRFLSSSGKDSEPGTKRPRVCLESYGGDRSEPAGLRGLGEQVTGTKEGPSRAKGRVGCWGGGAGRGGAPPRGRAC